MSKLSKGIKRLTHSPTGSTIVGAGLGFLIGGPPGAAVGGMVGGQIGANNRNEQLAREEMAFTERMSSTAHQREILDLSRAGLNPMLSGLGGSGASTPAGEMATMNNVGEGLVSNYLGVQNLKQYIMKNAKELDILDIEKVRRGNEAVMSGAEALKARLMMNEMSKHPKMYGLLNLWAPIAAQGMSAVKDLAISAASAKYGLSGLGSLARNFSFGKDRINVKGAGRYETGR